MVRDPNLEQLAPGFPVLTSHNVYYVKYCNCTGQEKSGVPQHPPITTLLSRLFPLNCFRGLETRINTSFNNVHNPSLPSILPSKTDRFIWCVKCTRFARRLLFHINRQLSSGAESLFQADQTTCSPFTKYHDHPYHYVKPRHLQVREKHDAGGLVTTVLPVHVGFPSSVRLRKYRQVRDVPLCERRVSGVR